jgi:spore coat polysaccharide biosynthesis protein SpsF
MNNIAIVLSARMASSRLPGKAMLPLGGVPIIQFILDRLRKSKYCEKVILATTKRPEDNLLAKLGQALNIQVFRGADKDVAARYIELANYFKLDWIVRVTGDCPFIDSITLDHCLSQWAPQEKEILWTTKSTFPIGIDYELISCAALNQEWSNMSVIEKEHVTLRFYRSDLEIFNLKRHFNPPKNWPKVSAEFTIDTPEDYYKARSWVDHFGARDFSVLDLLDLQKDRY